MSEKLSSLVAKYQKDLELEAGQTFLKGSFGRSLMGENEYPTRIFWVILCWNKAKTIEFLRESKLIKSEPQVSSVSVKLSECVLLKHYVLVYSFRRVKTTKNLYD